MSDPSVYQLGKSWDSMSAEERAIFTTHLMYEPNRHQLRPEQEILPITDWIEAFRNLSDLSAWCNRAEEWIERAAIRKADEHASKNRSIWGRRP